MDTVTGSPTSHPVVQLKCMNGRLLHVNCGLYAQWMLSDAGKDPMELAAVLFQNTIAGGRPSPRILSAVITMFWASVAKNFYDSKDPIPTEEYWAANIDVADEWQIVCKATFEASVKIPRSPMKTATAPANPSAPAESQNTDQNPPPTVQ
jgi:hypothetical protein